MNKSKERNIFKKSRLEKNKSEEKEKSEKRADSFPTKKQDKLFVLRAPGQFKGVKIIPKRNLSSSFTKKVSERIMLKNEAERNQLKKENEIKNSLLKKQPINENEKNKKQTKDISISELNLKIENKFDEVNSKLDKISERMDKQEKLLESLLMLDFYKSCFYSDNLARENEIKDTLKTMSENIHQYSTKKNKKICQIISPYSKE